MITFAPVRYPGEHEARRVGADRRRPTSLITLSQLRPALSNAPLFLRSRSRGWLIEKVPVFWEISSCANIWAAPGGMIEWEEKHILEQDQREEDEELHPGWDGPPPGTRGPPRLRAIVRTRRWKNVISCKLIFTSVAPNRVLQKHWEVCRF